MDSIIMILYALFESIWRRWFGGGFDKLGDNRFFQHMMGFIATGLALWFGEYHWIQVVLSALVLQGLFWARSHGCCFDFGHGTPDEDRYNQLWYWKYIRQIIPQNMWYGFAADFCLMFVRYSLPAIVLAIILMSPSCLLLGVCLVFVYTLCWIGYDFGLTKRPTELAEYGAGLTTGMLLCG